MECQVPSRIPRVFPLVGHRDDVRVVHVMPMVIAWGSMGCFERISIMLLKPHVDVIVVELLGPQHPGECLAHDACPVGIQRVWDHSGIEGVGLPLPLLH